MTDNEPYILTEPEELTTSAVFSSPHSGRAYPAEFLSRTRLSLRELRASEDVLVDALFESVPEFGAPLICATAPRAWLDLNRAPTELDPALITGVRPHGLSQRIAAGLGVVPRVVSEGEEIYQGKITLEEAERRIAEIHTPYHETIERLLKRSHDRFGAAVLFDCHSMPSEALRAAPRVMGQSPEIVLGDRFGAAADRAIVSATQAAFERAGFIVARNAPFAGGFITQRYGRPQRSLHAVQVEIDRGLYLNAETLQPNAAFQSVASRLRNVVAELVKITPDLTALAAE